MTTGKLILLRLFNITLGRFEFFSRALRKALERVLVTGRQDKYVASSMFFDMKDLSKNGEPAEREKTPESTA